MDKKCALDRLGRSNRARPMGLLFIPLRMYSQTARSTCQLGAWRGPRSAACEYIRRGMKSRPNGRTAGSRLRWLFLQASCYLTRAVFSPTSDLGEEVLLPACLAACLPGCRITLSEFVQRSRQLNPRKLLIVHWLGLVYLLSIIGPKHFKVLYSIPVSIPSQITVARPPVLFFSSISI